MDDYENELYIPSHIPDAEDIIAGIGVREAVIIGITFACCLLLAIVVSNVSNIFYGLLIAGTILSIITVMVRRDPRNETFLKKMRIVFRHSQAQKVFGYQRFNPYLEEEDEN